jgi:hypothetical protein
VIAALEQLHGGTEGWRRTYAAIYVQSPEILYGDAIGSRPDQTNWTFRLPNRSEELALSTGCHDVAAVKHLLNADELQRKTCEVMDVGFLERYARPMPNPTDFANFVFVPRWDLGKEIMAVTNPKSVELSCEFREIRDGGTQNMKVSKVMKLGKLSVNTIFEVFSPTEDEITHKIQAAADHVHASALPKIREATPSLVGIVMKDKMPSLLDVSIIGVMLRSWKKYKTIRQYLGKKAEPSSGPQDIPLADHTIKSSHEPYVEVILDGTRVMTVEFAVSLEIAISALVLHIAKGKIDRISTGNFIVSGELECEGVSIKKVESKPLRIPGSYRITSKDEAAAEESAL